MIKIKTPIENQKMFYNNKNNRITIFQQIDNKISIFNDQVYCYNKHCLLFIVKLLRFIIKGFCHSLM
jgi:hypothetical protein